MGLHPIVFLGIGFLVSGVSMYVGEGLVVFFYVGLLFILWGVFKLAAGYVMKKPTAVEEKKTERRLNQTPVIACPFEKPFTVTVRSNMPGKDPMLSCLPLKLMYS